MIGATPPSSICTGARRRQLREFAPHSPGKPYSSVEGRKPFAGKRRRRLREFAPHSRESLILPLRGANLSPGKAPAAAGVCASLPGKPYSSVEGRKPFTREEPPPPAGVCASHPGKPYSSVERRKPFTRKSPPAAV